MSMSEVTPVTIRYIHPPHHGYPYFMVMVMNDRLASLSFNVNQPSNSSNTSGMGVGCDEKNWKYLAGGYPQENYETNIPIWSILVHFVQS